MKYGRTLTSRARRRESSGIAVLQLKRAFTPLQSRQDPSRKPYLDAPAPTSPDARRRVAWDATLERQEACAGGSRWCCFTAAISTACGQALLKTYHRSTEQLGLIGTRVSSTMTNAPALHTYPNTPCCSPSNANLPRQPMLVAPVHVPQLDLHLVVTQATGSFNNAIPQHCVSMSMYHLAVTHSTP